jgi:hypothetical protein
MRDQDFSRHLISHKGIKIPCNGVPYADRDQWAGAITEDMEPFKDAQTGELRIGGCQKVFSRRDALRRHIKNSVCIG